MNKQDIHDLIPTTDSNYLSVLTEDDIQHIQRLREFTQGMDSTQKIVLISLMRATCLLSDLIRDKYGYANQKILNKLLSIFQQLTLTPNEHSTAGKNHYSDEDIYLSLAFYALRKAIYCISDKNYFESAVELLNDACLMMGNAESEIRRKKKLSNQGSHLKTDRRKN
jgi:hypothetical protein